MTTAAESLEPLRPDAPARRERRARRRIGKPNDGWVYLVLGLLTAGAWWLSTLKLFDAKSDLAYWLGVAGGSTMLGVFAYPMRKHLKVMQRWGAAKYWFVVHMMVGVVGPVLILVHSTFTIGSINAGVALFSMLIVAASGVVGRFLYVRLHTGLHGEKLTLQELRRAVSGDGEAVAKLGFAPQVQAELQGFEHRVLGSGRSVPRVVLESPWIFVRRIVLLLRCRAVLRRHLVRVAHIDGWSKADYQRRLGRANALVADYLRTVQRAAEFAAWERLFSLWHVVHLPFVYLMVLSAIAHVVAVHAY